MANKLNQLVCANAVSNTGFGNCFLDMQQIIGAFIVPVGFELTASEIQTLQASLIAKTKVATKLNRAFPVHKFVQMSDGSEDNQLQTFGYGGKKVVREGDYDWTFEFTEGGLCLLQGLRSFNSNGRWAIIFYDANFILFGTTGTTAGSLYGINTKTLWTKPWKPNDGSKTAMYSLQVVFEPDQINDDLAYVQADSYLTDIEGIQDILMTVNSFNEGTGVVNVSLFTRCGTDLFEVFPTEFAVTAVWSAANASTGGVIAVSSVAGVSGTKTWNVTLDTADSDWPSTTQGIIFDLKPLATLESNDIEGYESAGSATLATT